MFLKLNTIIIDKKVNASHQNNNNFENNIGTEVVSCNQLNDHIKKVKKAFWYGTLERESDDENFLKGHGVSLIDCAATFSGSAMEPFIPIDFIPSPTIYQTEYDKDGNSSNSNTLRNSSINRIGRPKGSTLKERTKLKIII